MKSWRFLALALSRVPSGEAAVAGDLQLTIACPAWAPEMTGQVEARTRASLLLENLDARRIHIECDADAISVEVESANGTLVRPVLPQAGVVEDDVIRTVESTLHELFLLAGPEPEPPATSEADESAPPVAAPAPSPPAPPPRRSVDSSAVPEGDRPQPLLPASSVFDMQARAIVEHWAGPWAWGGEAGATIGDNRLQYGLAIGGRFVTGEPPLFSLSEWNGAVRLQLTFPKLAGVSGYLGLGGSLLSAEPTSEVVPESSTMIGAGVVELGVVRAFFMGSIGLAPALGLRVFTAEREVVLNGASVLTLPVGVVQASLSLIHRRH